MLTKKQFQLLDFVAEDSFEGVAAAAKQLKIQKDELQSVYDELAEQGLVNGLEITEKGLEALEPYRVKRAVFIAAGFGSRMLPITLNTPKPLVRVNGVRMIDTLIDAVVAAGIEEIYVVRGYLAEQFDQLLYKYPMIKFLENPRYNQGNTILSVNCAGELLRNAYMFEADLILSNTRLVKKYQYESNYCGIPVKETEDWYFKRDENGYINEIGQGGKDCCQMIGIGYYTDEDGARFAKYVSKTLEQPGGEKNYVSYIPFRYYKDEFKISITECEFKDIVEIDSYKELCEIDPAYKVE